MKVKELLENIVDFNQARQKRDQQRELQQQWDKNQEAEIAHTQIVQNDEDETLTVKELAEFEEWMVTAKKKGRVPGFDTVDDVIHYIIAEVEMPNHITRSKAIEWFSDLSEEDREKVRMISHHADRMMQVYEILRTKLHGIQNTWNHRFNGKIPRGWDATDGAAWLDQEFSYDIKVLKNLKKAIAILGQ